MVWKTAIQLEHLQQTNRQSVTIDGHKILFILHNEEVHAVQAQCPHMKLPLAKGEVDGECALVCPFHKSTFDLKTGTVKCWTPWPPVVGALLGKLSKPKNLRVYPTKIEGGDIFVELQ